MGDAVKLTKAQRRILQATADLGLDAWMSNGARYGQAARRRREAIDQLMRLELLCPTIGPRFGCITPAGLSALTSKEQNNG